MRIIVHGGAGFGKKTKIEINGIISACKIGFDVLKNGGSAVDAVVAAIVNMEDNPEFNAGTGSSLSIKGEAEMDAAIMSDDLSCGAVAGIKNVKNPILVAKKVMEETDHVLLVGEGATNFARLMGFMNYNPATLKKKNLLYKWKKKLKLWKKPHYFSDKIFNLSKKYETVGACCIDKNKRLAAGTSTGGLFLHLPGRVGDTPIIGAGTYACKYGAVSCTGHGEKIIKICLSKYVCDKMENYDAQEAINFGLDLANKYNCECGIIAIDKNGNIGWGYNTKTMVCAYTVNGEIKVV